MTAYVAVPGEGPGPEHQPVHESTADLVTRAKNSDKSAWEELVKRFSPHLRSLLQGRVNEFFRSSYDSEDLMQSALFTAFRELEQFEYRGKGSLERWFSTIALNRVIDYARRMQAGRRDVRLNEPLPRDEAHAGPEFHSKMESPQASTSRKDQYWQLVRVLSDLPERQGLPAILKMVLQVDIAQIAEILGMSESSVRRSIANVMGTVERLLRGTGSESE